MGLEEVMMTAHMRHPLGVVTSSVRLQAVVVGAVCIIQLPARHHNWLILLSLKGAG